MKVKINDKTVELADGASLADALAAANIKPTGIATAINGKVIAASYRSATALNDGDTILIIKAFCGG